MKKLQIFKNVLRRQQLCPGRRPHQGGGRPGEVGRKNEKPRPAAARKAGVQAGDNKQGTDFGGATGSSPARLLSCCPLPVTDTKQRCIGASISVSLHTSSLISNQNSRAEAGQSRLVSALDITKKQGAATSAAPCFLFSDLSLVVKNDTAVPEKPYWSCDLFRQHHRRSSVSLRLSDR